MEFEKYEEPFVLLPKEEHTASVIILHGLADTGHGLLLLDMNQKLGKGKFKL